MRWITREPVRLWLYGAATAGLAVAVAYGVISPTAAVPWRELLSALLVVPVAEGLRLHTQRVPGPVQAPTAPPEPRTRILMADQCRLDDDVFKILEHAYEEFRDATGSLGPRSAGFMRAYIARSIAQLHARYVTSDDDIDC